MKIYLTRFEENKHKQTLGHLEVDTGSFKFKLLTLELAWWDNKPFISCIPEGTYVARKRYSRRFRDHFMLDKIPGRTWILIHSGNYHHDTKGCILVGQEFKDINMDGFLDVVKSKAGMNTLNKISPTEEYFPKCLANLIGVSKATIYNWMKLGKLVDGDRIFLKESTNVQLQVYILGEDIIEFYEKALK